MEHQLQGRTLSQYTTLENNSVRTNQVTAFMADETEPASVLACTFPSTFKVKRLAVQKPAKMFGSNVSMEEPGPPHTWRRSKSRTGLGSRRVASRRPAGPSRRVRPGRSSRCCSARYESRLLARIIQYPSESAQASEVRLTNAQNSEQISNTQFPQKRKTEPKVKPITSNTKSRECEIFFTNIIISPITFERPASPL